MWKLLPHVEFWWIPQSEVETISVLQRNYGCSLSCLCLVTAGREHWFVDTLQCLGDCNQPVSLIKFLLDDGHGKNATKRGGGEENCQLLPPCASLSLSNRWANCCCSTRWALDGSNTVLSTGMNIHTVLTCTTTTVNSLVPCSLTSYLQNIKYHWLVCVVSIHRH